MTVLLPHDILRVGFGCSRLRGGWLTRPSRRLVQAAYDAGIRYFDAARMYGDGESEGVLGLCLGYRRRGVFIASKAGILPPSGLMANRWCRRAVRLAGRALPAIVPATAHARFGMFEPETLRRSVETSLRQLRTDRLDALLLHEVDAPHLADGEVVALLGALRAEGKVGVVGIASTRTQTARILWDCRGWPQIVQVANSVFEDGLRPLVGTRGILTVTHSVLAGSLERIMARLAADPQFRSRWAAHIHIDPGSRDRVAELLLAEALDANRDGMVLFSSTAAPRVAAAARIARDQPFAPDQIAGLRRLLDAFRPRP